MKSTTIINQLAFEVWDSIKEYQLAKFSYLQAVARTADDMGMSQAEASDLYKSYERKLKSEENSKELGVIA
tara:strand:+ start:260 stop:472 length:213 start_codon:yes stop_codon:yes gene_type:complete